MAGSPEMERILGAQQDQIARDRYELAKLIEQVPQFKDCKTTFEVYQRIGIVGGDNGLRAFAADILARQNPQPHPHFIPSPWIERILGAIKSGNEAEFKQTVSQALLASVDA